MIIAILFFLISDTVSEKYRYERLQGQCSAWCYETYGSWNETKLSDPDTVHIYQCLDEDADQDCRDCDIGCKYECKYRSTTRCKRECDTSCNGKPACLAACSHHEEISEIKLNMTTYLNNLHKSYPKEIYEDPEKRNYTSLGLKWLYENHFDNKTAVVFLIFLSNITTTQYNESQSSVTYLGSTPHHNYTVEHLSPNYCYSFKMLTVTSTAVLGSSESISRTLTVNAKVKAENITATSAKLSFPIRPCEKDDYTMHLVNTDFNNVMEINGVQTETRYSAEASKLTPNTEYRISVDRTPKTGTKELFSWVGVFKTLLKEPGTSAKVTGISDVTSTSIKYYFSVNEEAEMWDSSPDYYLLRSTSSTSNVTTEYKIEMKFEAKTGDLVTDDLDPYTEYCVEVAVANSKGAGPFSEMLPENCQRTATAGASRPGLAEVNKTALHTTINITRPDRENGLLEHYRITYFESDEPVSTRCSVAEENVTQCIVTHLDAHTTYNISVQAINSKGDEGAPSYITITTLQSLPEAPPNITSCNIAQSNKTHVSISVTWNKPNIDLLNGEITNYTLNYIQKEFYDVDGIERDALLNKTVVIADWQSVIVVSDREMELLHSPSEIILVKLALSTIIGEGPSSTEFQCEIEDPPSAMRIAQVLIPVFCVVALFLLLMLGFFYFFRFKTYKKTPYEEIKKLIAPDAFSPCQHCMHNKEPKKWDVFICHVSEDIDYIRQLKEAFVREKIEVFFAKDELSWGCELHRVINDGLRFSKYGLVVLSKQFVEKCSKWTSTELSSLHSKSRLSSQDCILPVWKKDITELEVGDFDMTLVGIKALKEEEMTVDQMAVELKKKLRNDGCWGCSMRKPHGQINNTNSNVVFYEDPDSPDDSGYTITNV